MYKNDFLHKKSLDQMMTFVLDADTRKTAKWLSNLHLNKQITEAMQIINVIENKTTKGGWVNHPMVLSWKGGSEGTRYLNGLKTYYNTLLKEWRKRGGGGTRELYKISKDPMYPWWYSWDRLHQSHKAMLMRKNPAFYDFEVEDEYHEHGYIWPCKIKKSQKDDDLSEITAPIPDNLVNAKFCKAKLKSGARQGEKCGLLIKNGGKYCGRHSK